MYRDYNLMSLCHALAATAAASAVLNYGKTLNCRFVLQRRRRAAGRFA